MRKVLLLAAALVACGRADTPPADTAAPAAEVASAPAALTPADVRGNWTGVSTLDGSDSVISRWTITNVSDTSGYLVYEGTTDQVPFTTSFSGDSMIAHSAPYTNRNLKGSPSVVFHSVGRLSNGKLTGTSQMWLASKQDSVVARARWEASKSP